VELYFHSLNTSSWHGAYLGTRSTLLLLYGKAIVTDVTDVILTVSEKYPDHGVMVNTPTSYSEGLQIKFRSGDFYPESSSMFT
jgi:hypothetical protein